MADVQHSIKVAAQRSGLSPHVIRIWERRYGAVEPQRTETNRRLYSEQSVERLSLLRRATALGHNIGSIARLSEEQLRVLVEDSVQRQEVVRMRQTAEARDAETWVEACLGAVRRLDAAALEAALGNAMVALGSQGLLCQVLVPFTHRLGMHWREGHLSAAHEHFASGAVRVFLGSAIKPYANATPANAPGLIVATPAGQVHEMGAVLVAAAAAGLGWRVTCLGASLPAAEIAGAAVQNKARAVALSIVYPGDDPNLPQELIQLRRFLPGEVSVLVGGRAAESYRPVLRQIGAMLAESLDSIYGMLEDLRAGRAA